MQNTEYSHKLKQILALVEDLNPTEYYQLQREITPFALDNALEDNIKNTRFDNGRVCPFCGCTEHIVRNGFRYYHPEKQEDETDEDFTIRYEIESKKTKQRYKCKDCGKSFVMDTNSVVSNSLKSLDIWKTYVKCMIKGMSIRESAEECNIHRNTSFIWRHKILDSLRDMQDNLVLKGIIEADETFFEVSYKGNHTNNPTFDLGREPHKRGKDNGYVFNENTQELEKSKKKRGLSNYKVCVPCAISRNGISVAKVGKLGKVSTIAIKKTIGDRISKNATLCTDKEKAYRPFSQEKEITLVQLKEHQTKVSGK